MAVYKPTYCTPFLTTVDPRVGTYGAERNVNYGEGKENLYVEKPVKFITCKVDSSNKNVTGYKIKVLDKNNNQIFPVEKDSDGNYVERISPISELQEIVFGYQNDGTPGVNSGYNGTTLQIPFFQNIINKNLQEGTDNDYGFYNSYNAIYYKSPYLVDHVISYDFETPSAYANKIPEYDNPFAHPTNWVEYTDVKGNKDGTLVYNNWENDEQAKKENKIILDGDLLQEGEMILFNNNYEGASDDDRVLNGIYTTTKMEVTKTVTDEDTGEETEVFDYYVTKLEKIRDCQEIAKYFSRTSMQDITEIYVTVLHGENYHDTYWYMLNSDSKTNFFFTKDETPVPWVDYNGNKVENFGCNDDMFKWQITLYQGNYELYGDGSIAQFVTYENVDQKWLDMTLMSGKILGTTSERVQLGRFFEDDEGNKKGIIPEGTSTDPLVLQETWLAVGETEDSILSNKTRCYVKTYDSTMGHAYLRTSDQAAKKLSDESYQYCQFFEHSNDIEYIEDTDIVNYTFTTNVAIEYYAYQNQVWESFISEALWYDGTSANTRKLVVGVTDEEKDKFKSVKSGDLILLIGQTKTKQNGVYELTKEGTYYTIKRASSYDEWSDYLGKIIFTMGADDASYKNSNIECLAQAGAYMMWNPLNTSDNSGSSPLIFIKERPIVLFKNKIYKTFDFYTGTEYEYQDDTYIGTEVSYTGGKIDGTEVQEGDSVIYSNSVYGKVTEVDNGLETFVVTLEGSIKSDIRDLDLGTEQYVYIETGQTYGKKTFKTIKADGTLHETNDLSTAQILRNSTTRTYITAWTGLEKQMQLCLLGNKFVQYTDGTYSKWIKVEDFNDSLYYIDHKELEYKLESESESDDSIPWHYDVRFFFRSSEENPFYSCETPYFKIYKNNEAFSDLSCDYLSYDLNWHEGDEDTYEDYNVASSAIGVYTAIESPTGSPKEQGWYEKNEEGVYVLSTDEVVDKNKTYYTFDKNADSFTSSTYKQVVTTGGENPAEEGWYEKNENQEFVQTTDTEVIEGKDYYEKSENESNLKFKTSYDRYYTVLDDNIGENGTYVPHTTISGHAATFKAEIVHFSQTSWESFEWKLYNSSDNVTFDEIQDTGICYDKDIYVTFYGLSSDTNKPYYKVNLAVEDDYSEVLEYSFNIKIADGIKSCIADPDIGGFTAIKDCDTQSVLINFHAVPEHFDIINDAYSIYRREYEVYANPNPTIQGYYDELNDKFYKDDKVTEAVKSKCYIYEDLDTGYKYVYNDIVRAKEYPYLNFTLAKESDLVKVFKGDWEPVLLKSNKKFFRDFNIKNGRTYQYIVYPNNELYGSEQLFANYDGYILKDNEISYEVESGEDPIIYNQPYMAYWVRGEDTSYKTGEPLPINYPYWTLAELEPEDIDEIDANSPIVKKKYKVDDTNIWMFKYSLETGAITQNMNKTEIQGLSKYPKFGYSQLNADSGEISALLGSEIVLSSKERYIERLRESRVTPLSTNERVEMLNKWKEMCVSKKPKLLKDVKGNSWIVQILSNSNTSMNFVKNIPDTISFSWKQIEDTKNVIIYGDFDDEKTPEIVNTYGEASWAPVYKDRTAYGSDACCDKNSNE